MVPIELEGKRIVVTGAASGLGRAMALGLADAGARVLAVDVDLARAKETAGAHRSARGSIEPFAADVRSVEACEATIGHALKALGGLTGLVNCAGLGMPHISRAYLSEPVKFWTTDPQRWQDIIDVNVRGPFLMARAATPHLLAAKWGRIVNITTSLNTMIRGGNMPYGQSKAALEAASNSWAEDLAGTGVTVNVLVPGGAADTPIIPEESPYDRAKLVKPDVMVAPIRWLMSELSDGVTGRRFLGRLWDPAAPWQEAAVASGAGAAWPELAAAASGRGQPKPDGGFRT